MKLEELIRRTRGEINSRIARHNAITEDLEQLRAAETPDEERITVLLTERQNLAAERAALTTQLDGYESELREDQAVARLQQQSSPSGAPADQRESTRTPVSVVTEPRTYSRESDPQGRRFLSDVVGDQLGNREARERLSRHMAEERTERGAQVQRAVTAAGSPGTIIPVYLIDLYAPKGRPGRKFADQCRHHDLPETGMTVYIPRQTAKTAVGLQATELDAVAESDYDDENIAVAVRTASGSQSISRQAAERGVGTEDIVFGDLLKSYDTSLDSLLLNSAVWGLLAVANAVTYTDADPTAPEAYRKILGAVANVEDTLLDFDEDDLITLMRGRRWAWFNGEVTNLKPFIAQPSVPLEAFGTNAGNPYPAGVRGFLPNGGRVVTDNNLPADLGLGTNEDVVVVVAQHEAHLWEDPAAPLYIRAEQTQAKNLAINLVVYGYFAACFDRVVDEQGTPKAVHQKLTGTGLVAPTF